MDEQFVHVAHFHVKERRLHMGLSGGPYVWMEKRRSSWWHFPPKNLPGSLIRTSPQHSKQCLRACMAKSRQSWSTRCGTFLSFHDGKIDVAHHDHVSVMLKGAFGKSAVWPKMSGWRYFQASADVIGISRLYQYRSYQGHSIEEGSLLQFGWLFISFRLQIS